MSARRRTSLEGCSPEYQISNIYGQQIYQIYRQRASSEGYSPELTNKDRKADQNFNDGDNYNGSAPQKKSQGQFQGSENAATFTLALLFPALILPSLKTTNNQSSLKLDLF